MGEGRRHQNWLIHRTAHHRNAAHFVYRWARDGKVKPFPTSDIAVEDFPDVQAEIHVGYRFAFCLPTLIQNCDSLTRSNRCRECRAACACSVFRGENGKRTVADQLEHIATVLMDRRDDHISIVIQQWDHLFWCRVSDTGKTA